MHIDQEHTQRLIHGELTAATAAEMRAHLAVCANCRTRVAAAEEEESRLLGLLQYVDHARPPLRIETVTTRATRMSFVRWAAGVLLFLGAGGLAYAIPGLPVRGWIDDLVKPQPPSAVPSASSDEPVVPGIVVDPGDHFTVVFSEAAPDASARVILTDSSQLAIRAANGTATFTSEIDRLVVDDYTSATRFEIHIPRTARHVEILVGDRSLFVSENSRVVTAARATGDGAFVLSLTPQDGRSELP